VKPSGLVTFGKENNSMSVVKIWVHLVFATKHRQPFLTNSIRRDVFQHILKNARDKGIEIDFVNGYYDHAHCLFKLPPQMSIATAAQLIKGESSHWINQEGLTHERFEWQDDYYAESVSPKDVGRVRRYIKTQEEHHRNVSFEKEIEGMEYFIE
jgi:putative transposase